MSFFQYFFGIDSDREEAVVPCVFPHQTSGGQEYYEQNASAHVNITKNVYHCKACGRGYSEAKFISDYLNCAYTTAIKLQLLFNNNETKTEWVKYPLNTKTLQTLLGFNISSKVIKELSLISGTKDSQILFPVFMFGKLLDIRTYDPGNKPKMKSREGAPAGLIIPYDEWMEDHKKVTIICAGEKDMAVARSHGFNAITLTGGESALPIIYSGFKGRKIIICYDNDDAGINGAKRLAVSLQPYCESVKICTKFHEVCKEKGEDIENFFNKYGKTREDLIRYLKTAEEVKDTEQIINSHLPLVSLFQASQPEYTGKMVRSNIQIVATSDATYTIPTVLVGQKWRASENDSKDTMEVGDSKMWDLNDSTLKDVLHLLDNNFTETALAKNYKTLLKIPHDETFIRITKPARATVHKAFVTDLFETNDDTVVPMEYLVYSIDCKLEAGKKYLATYKIVPHPYKGQQLTMVVTNVTEANDSVSNFKLTDDIRTQLSYIKNLPGTVEEKMNTIAERFKHYLGYNGCNDLIILLDLAYHTVFGFDFGSYKNERGYLDTLIVGESRVGKSTTANAMRNTYGLGTFISLAGNAATVAGLIGGSNKVNGTFQTRAGVIPQNHKGLLIFEELSKTNTNLIRELTDIRSSGEVRISRVSGNISMPGRVRYITLSNAKCIDGVTKPLSAYPNGISIVQELVGAAEDIARYDIINILGDETVSESDPLWQPQPPIPADILRSRVRWVWSREVSRVLFDEGVPERLILHAKQLAKTYSCHVKIFGVETWKKLARISIAVAGCTCSSNDSFESILVLDEHVDYAVHLMHKLYDNPTFRFKEYVAEEKKYTTIDSDGVTALQNVFMKCPALLLYLEHISSANKNALQAASGLNNDEYNAVMNRLIQGLFIKIVKYEMVPTVRFRLGMNKIDRTRLLRIGES
jgi:hypothetical protein